MEFAASLQFPGTKTLPNPFLVSYPHLTCPELPSVAVRCCPGRAMEQPLWRHRPFGAALGLFGFPERVCHQSLGRQ